MFVATAVLSGLLAFVFGVGALAKLTKLRIQVDTAAKLSPDPPKSDPFAAGSDRWKTGRDDGVVGECCQSDWRGLGRVGSGLVNRDAVTASAQVGDGRSLHWVRCAARRGRG